MFNIIIIPRFNDSEMGRKSRHQKVGSRMMYKMMMMWVHVGFRERLALKAEEHRKCICFMSEAYMSKTCSWCGWMNQKLGGRKVFYCQGCSLNIDRGLRNLSLNFAGRPPAPCVYLQ